jgi:hypothetical protein
MNVDKMTQKDAIEYLKIHYDVRRPVTAIYDMRGFEGSDLIFLAMPDFEYPDWTHRSLKEFIKICEKSL